MEKHILSTITVAMYVLVMTKSSSSTTPERRPIKFFTKSSPTTPEYQPTNPIAQSSSTTHEYQPTNTNVQSSSTTLELLPINPNAQSASTSFEHQPTNPTSKSSATTPEYQLTNPNSQSSSTTNEHQPTHPNVQSSSTKHEHQPKNPKVQSSSTKQEHQPTNPKVQSSSTSPEYQPTNENAQSASTSRQQLQNYSLILLPNIVDGIFSVGSCELLESPCSIGYTCEATRDTVMCIHRCSIDKRVCQNQGDCLYDPREDITFCRCIDDPYYVYTGDHCEVKVEKLALQSKYIAAIAGSAGGAIVIAAITVIVCLVRTLRKQHVEEEHTNHVGLTDYKERKSHKKAAKSNTYWDNPATSGTSDFHTNVNKTKSYAKNNQKANQEKHRGRLNLPSANNTYWDALDARGSLDSHPYSSYREVRKMDERKHHGVAGFKGHETSPNQDRIPHGAHVHRTQPRYSAEGDLYRSINSSSHYDYIGATPNAEVGHL